MQNGWYEKSCELQVAVKHYGLLTILKCQIISELPSNM